jgi:hypothetical protein
VIDPIDSQIPICPEAAAFRGGPIVVMAGHSRLANGVASLAHSRLKNGVASLAYGPGRPRL